MATQENYANSQVVERWTNEGAQPGYYSGSPLAFVRALTTAEAASLASQDSSNTSLVNRQTLLQRAQQALTSNATYLALASPTSAQTTAQVKALTRQVNALIRLLAVGDTSNISDS